MSIRISHPKDEGILQASKWLSFRALLDQDELEDLIAALPTFFIYNVSNLVTIEDASLSVEAFKNAHLAYISSLKEGKVPQESKVFFSSIWTTSPKSIYAFPAKQEHYIIKPLMPVVQLSQHHFSFSPINETFHSMVHSQEAISWGLQFSYPQIYSNSIQGDVIEVLKNPDMPNTPLFRILSKWMRDRTRPVPFLFQGKRINPTFRIGKQCLTWIHHHPQLTHLEVKT